MALPPEPLDEFLHWFRETTEAVWQNHRPITLKEQKRYGVGGSDWKTGTKWRPGLTDAQIADLERAEGRPFPEDYRLFLSILGAPDRKQIGFGFRGHELIEREHASLPDWLDPQDIASRRADFLESILFDVKHDMWLSFWGEEPNSLSEKINRVTKLVEEAPPLLPVFEHRAIPSVRSDRPLPVLSIHQTDAIVIASSIREALLVDMGDLIGFPFYESFDTPAEMPEDYGFWRDLVKEDEYEPPL